MVEFLKREEVTGLGVNKCQIDNLLSDSKVLKPLRLKLYLPALASPAIRK